jgi:hypothetical protein
MAFTGENVCVADNVLRIIAIEPTWTPAPSAADAAKELLRRFVPAAKVVEARRYDATVFIDQGGNWERVVCPSCGIELDTAWWQDKFDRAGQSRFCSLEVVTPCCGSATTLNDLDFQWPAGFACFEVYARNPGRGWLCAGELDRLERALGIRVRQIMAHY